MQTGFLSIDKPAGWTSHDVVAKLRGVTQTQTIGHAGTLDPFATGVLIVGVGREATKRLNTFLTQDKTYLATARFDGTTDTDDVTGNRMPADLGRTQGSPRHPSDDSIRAAFASQAGAIQQIPPAYSAKKVGGKKMYDLARAGKPAEAKPAAVTVYDIAIQKIDWPDVTFSVRCSSGTYIRAIARDVGQVLGTGGYLTALTRTSIGKVTLDQCVALGALTRENWQTFLWSFPSAT